VAEPEYDAFLSYSHTDHRIAPAVQRGLHQLARRWYRPRALRVFLDRESLAATPSLWMAINNALGRSRYFILMASPEAATSQWVGQEVDYWRENRGSDTFLIVLTKGTIAWRGDDFDWDRTDALPPGLAAWFTSEPMWVDLSWVHEDEELSLRHSRFRSALASVAAPLHGMAKDEVDSEDVRQHRGAARARRTAVSLLAVLTAVVLVLGGVAVWQRGEAAKQRDRALSRDLAGRSELVGDSDPVLAKLLSVAAWRVSPTPEAHAGMLLAAARPSIGVLDTPSDAVAFSPDGKTLATGGSLDSVRLWDVATHREVATLSGHTEAVQSLVFSPDGKTLASAADDATARLWDVATGRQIGSPVVTPRDSFLGKFGFDPSISFRPDGKVLATGGEDGVIRLWDVASRRQVGALAGHKAAPIGLLGPSVAFSPNGAVLASASIDGTLRYWDAAAQRQSTVLEGLPTQPIGFEGPAVVFSPDGTVVATAATDGTVRVWDAVDRRWSGSLVAGRTQPNDDQATPTAAFAPVGTVLATGAHDGTIRLWDVDRRQQIGGPLTGHTRAVVGVAFSPDKRTLASASLDGTVRLWDIGAYLETVAPLTGDTGPLRSVAFSPDGRTVATGGYGDWAADEPDGMGQCLGGGWNTCTSGNVNAANTKPTVSWWDAAKGMLVDGRQASRPGVISSVAFSPDGTMTAAGGHDTATDAQKNGRVSLFQGGRLVGDLVTNTASVAAVAFSPDGRTLAVAGSHVQLWDVDRRERIAELGSEGTFAVAFSPDGTKLAVGEDKETTVLWDVTSRKRLGELTERSGGVIGTVAFSPDGKILATAGEEGAIRLWDVDSREQTGQPLVGHTGPIYSLAFSPDGQIIATGSGDTSVRLWDVAARRQVSLPPMGHHLPVRAVAFSPDGRTVASAGLDDALRLWDVSYTLNVASTLCETAKRSLTPDEWRRYVPDVPYRRICPA